MTRTRTVLAMAAALAAAGLVAPAAQAQTENKPFSVVIEPAEVPSHTDVEMVATITNHAKSQRIGSVNLTPPAYVTPGPETTTGFGIKGVKADPRPGVGPSVEYVGAAGDNPGGVIQVRNAAIPPDGGTLVLRMVVDTSEVAGEWLWGVRAKQANDFNGDGNDFSLDAQRSALQTTVHSTGDPAQDYDEDVAQCPPSSTCEVVVTYRDAEQTITLAATGTPAEQQSAASSQTRLSPLDSLNSNELVAQLPAPGMFGAGLSEGLDDTLCGREGTGIEPFLGSATGLVDGPTTHSKEVVLTVDTPLPIDDGPDSLCFAGPLPTLSGSIGGVPFLYADDIGGDTRVSLFFPSYLAPCDDPDVGDTDACMVSAESVDGAWQYTVEVPAGIPDPVYRG